MTRRPLGRRGGRNEAKGRIVIITSSLLTPTVRGDCEVFEKVIEKISIPPFVTLICYEALFSNEIIDKGHSYLYDPNQAVYHFWTKNGATWKALV